MPKRCSVEEVIASAGPDLELAGFACVVDPGRTVVMLRCDLRGGDGWTFLLPPAVALHLRDSLALAIEAQCWPQASGPGRDPSLLAERRGSLIICRSCDVHSFSDCAYLAFISTTNAALAVRLVAGHAATMLADLTALAQANPGWCAAADGPLPSTRH